MNKITMSIQYIVAHKIFLINIVVRTRLHDRKTKELSVTEWTLCILFSIGKTYLLKKENIEAALVNSIATSIELYNAKGKLTLWYTLS